jgi:hypothetical protein
VQKRFEFSFVLFLKKVDFFNIDHKDVLNCFGKFHLFFADSKGVEQKASNFSHPKG